MLLASGAKCRFCLLANNKNKNHKSKIKIYLTTATTKAISIITDHRTQGVRVGGGGGGGGHERALSLSTQKLARILLNENQERKTKKNCWFLYFIVSRPWLGLASFRPAPAAPIEAACPPTAGQTKSINRFWNQTKINVTTLMGVGVGGGAPFAFVAIEKQLTKTSLGGQNILAQ